MKKRLLSAALALAMVLTLLPVSAFAASGDAPSGNGASIRYFVAATAKIDAITVDGWYEVSGSGNSATYTQVTTGVVTATGNWANNTSGKWYSTVNSAHYDGVSSVKLIDNVNENASLNLTHSMTVDVNGKVWTVTDINVWPQYTDSSSRVVNNLTREFKILNSSATRGTVTTTNGITTSNSPSKGNTLNVALTVENVTFTGKIQQNHAGSGSVTINNASVSGETNVIGWPAANGTTVSGGSVTISGSQASTGIVRLYNGDASDYVVTGGTISVTGGATVAGITFKSTACSSNRACITVANSTVSGGFTMMGDGTYADIDSSTVAAMSIFGRADGTKLTDNEKKNLAAPKVYIHGINTNVTSIAQATGTEVLTKAYTVEVSNNACVAQTINLPYAEIIVNGASVLGQTNLGTGTLTLGSKSNTTMNTTLSTISLGRNDMAGNTVTLNVDGTNVTTGAISETGGNNQKITVNIPATGANPTLDTNKFASVTPTTLSNWSTGTISGGHWTTAIGLANISLLSGVKYLVTDNRYVAGYTNTYWKGSQIDELVSIWQEATAVRAINATGKVDVDTALFALTVHQPATVPGVNPDTPAGPTTNTDTAVFKARFLPGENYTFTLPTKVNRNKVSEWSKAPSDTLGIATNDANVDTPIAGGGDYTVYARPSGAYILSADSLGFRVTKVSQVSVNVSSNPTVTATFSSGVITLSGSATTPAGNNTATIDLVLKTDAGNFNTSVAWNTETNTLTFVDVPTNGNLLRIATDGSLYYTNSMKAIQLSVDKSEITLKNGGLTKEASLLTVRGNTASVDKATGAGGKGGMTTTVNIADSVMNKTQRENLAKEWTITAGVSSSPVDFSNSPAVLEKLGAELAKINNTQVTNWLKEAQNEAYRKQNNNQNATTDAQRATTGYNTVAAVLYMNVTISSIGNQVGIGNSGLLTATMTPYLRVEVQHSMDPVVGDWEKFPPIVKRTVSLGQLTGEMGTVKVILPGTTVVNNFRAAGYAHQNSTYVYEVTAAPTDMSNSGSFTLTHKANTGDGFGTIVINSTPAPVELQKYKAPNSSEPYTPNKKLYDAIQPALDDSVNNDTVKVTGTVLTGDHPIEMTGTARTVFIDITGNATISAKNTNGVVISENVNNHTYQVQLTRDNIVKPEEKPTGIPITVNGATGGTASVSKSRANEGDVITITLSPSSGYQSSGVTVRSTDGTTTTNIGVSGSGNRFTFTVPKGSKGVTVTPAFVRVNTGVLITVSGGTYGTATTSAGSNRVAVGSTVSVTVEPRSGYRTMGLYVTADTGSTATPYRTGVNTFTFTVPNATSSVVVTPRFDVNNGTVFEDVWSTDYYSSPVSWAVRQGVTDGTDTYHFSPGQSCNRVQMVTFLWRAAGRPSTAGMANPFYDVSPSMGNDFYNAILWANAKGITNGDGSTTRFNPYKTVTRAEAVTFLWRYEGQPAASTNSGFYDVPAREWYAPAVTWAVGRGITNGDGSTTRFNPNGACLRAQIVTFLYRDITGARA